MVSDKFKTSAVRNEIKFFNGETRVFWWCGLWMSNVYRASTNLYVKRIQRLIFCVIFVTNAILVLLGSYPNFVRRDWDLAMENIIFGFAFAVISFKAWILITKQTSIENCIQKLEIESTKCISDMNVKWVLNICKWMFTVCIGTMMITLPCYFIAKVWKTKNSQDDRTFPFFIYLPFKINKSPVYEILLAYQMVATVINCLVMISFDALFCGIAFLCVALIRNINTGIHEDLDDQIYKNKIGATQGNLLKHVIVNFNAVFSCVKAVNTTFYSASFLHFCHSYFVLTYCAFQVTQISFEDIKFISMGASTVQIWAVLFVYCYVGQAFKSEVARTRLLLYTTNWYEQEKSYKYMIQFSLQFLERESYFKAGDWIELSNKTLMEVMRAFMSLITFLLNVKQ